MAKLLPTRLPQALDEVSPEVFNRLVRILELNLGQFDPNRTPQFNQSELGKLMPIGSGVMSDREMERLMNAMPETVKS
jgi:hypothetical protein